MRSTTSSSSTGNDRLPIISPFQSIPPEILTQIMLFTFYKCPSERSDPHREQKYTTLTLSKVCSSWRALATATPSLWATFHLNPPSSSCLRSPEDMHSIVEHIHTWLGRSGTRLLTIDFTFRWQITRDFMPLFEALAAYASRWETLIIGREVLFGLWPNFCEMPLLRTLSQKQELDRYPYSPTPVSGIWDERRCKDDDINTVLEVLQHCSHLETFYVDVKRTLDFIPIPQIEHARLQVLHLTLHRDCPGHRLFESLTLPALSSLVLVDRDYTRRSYFEPLVLLFNRSFCELEHLALTDFVFTSNELSTFLEHESCQTLTSLEIKETGQNSLVDDEILRQLTYVDPETGMEETPLCPNLDQLSLRWSYSKYTSPGMLGTMILSRCSNGRSMSKLTLSWGSLGTEDMTLLRLARKCGLEQLDYRYHG